LDRGKDLPPRSPREEENRQDRQGSLDFKSNVPTARQGNSGEQLAAILFFSVFRGELGALGGSTLPSRYKSSCFCEGDKFRSKATSC
jgi:hypothetical protein